MGEIQLKRWTVRSSVGGICVDGLRVDDASGIHWHSSSIVKRINSRLVETHSGSRYRLLGDLDEVYAKEISDDLFSLISRFKRGFPKKWKSMFESTERATSAKFKATKKRTVVKTFLAPDNKTQSRQSMSGKKSYETLRSVRPVNCHTNKRTVLSSKRICEETPKVSLHSVTRSMTKKLQAAKKRLMPDSDGSSSEDTLSGTILALRKRCSPLGQTLRKRKRPSDIRAASKKRRVKGDGIGKNLRQEYFPTPGSQIADEVLLKSFSSLGTSPKKQKRMISTTIEPDVLTLEGLLSPPEDTLDNTCKMVSGHRIVLNPVPFDLGEEFEEDILQRSFLDFAQADFGKRQSQPRSRTVQAKQSRASTKQRKSQSQVTSKSRNVKSRRESPGLVLNSEMIYGGHNLRLRTSRKDVIPGTTAELRGKPQRIESKSRSNQKKQQPSVDNVNDKNNQQMNAKTSKNKAVSLPKICLTPVMVKSSLVKDPAQLRPENCEQKQPLGYSANEVKSTTKKDSRNHVWPTSPSTAGSRKSERLDVESGISKKKRLPRESENKQQMTVKTSVDSAVSGSTIKPVGLELHTLSSKVIVCLCNDVMMESVTQGRNISSGDNELGIAERLVVTESTGTINADRAVAKSDGLDRIGDLPKTLKPKAKKAASNKKANARKKEIEKAVVIESVNVENGQCSLSTQGLHDQLEDNTNSNIKVEVVPSLPANSVQLEVVEECILTKCSEENVAVDVPVTQPKRTKRRKVAEVPASVVSMTNQSQKSLPKSNSGLTKKASETNDSILAKKKDQIINVKLLGGRGTLKRQKELRKLVERNMQCEDNNDFFSSTPFQGSRVRHFADFCVVPSIDNRHFNYFHLYDCLVSPVDALTLAREHLYGFPRFEDDDEDIFAGGNLSKALNCDMADVTPHGLFRVMDYTANKTPAATPSTSTTPAGIKRKRSDQEAYVHRVKKMLRLGRRKDHTSRQSIPKKPRVVYQPVAGSSRMPMVSLDKDVFEVKKVGEQASEDEDCYFADD